MDASTQQTPVEPADARDNPRPRGQRGRNRRRADRPPRQPRPDAEGQPGAAPRGTPPPPSRIAGNRRRGHEVPAGPPPVRCVRSVVAVPDTWPVASRTGIATAALVEVDRRGDERLLCDGLHDGPHFWPDVEPSPPIWDAELDASLASPDAVDERASEPDHQAAPASAVLAAIVSDDDA